MKRLNRTFDPTFLIDLINVFLFTVGPVFLVLELIDQGLTFPVCCAIAGVQVLFLALVTRKWWVFPGLLALFALAFGVIVWVLDWSVVQPWLLDGVAWVQDGLPPASDYSMLKAPLLGVLTLPITALFYLLIRKLFHILPLALLTLGVNVVTYLMESSDWQGVLLSGLAGLILCLPRAAQKKQEALPRRYSQLLALGLALLCLAGAFYIVPMDDGKWQVESVRVLFTDIQDWYDNQFGSSAGGAPRARSELLPLGDRLGGDLERTANLTLRVNSNYEVLLAGRYDDTYNGSQWYHGWQNGRFRWGSLLWRGRRNDAFQSKLPIGSRKAQELYAAMTRYVDAEVTVQSTEYTLFAPATPEYAKFSNRDGLYPYFNRVGELFTDKRYSAGTRYTVRSVELCRDMKNFAANMDSLLKLTKELEDPYMEEIRARYTWLPKELPDSVRSLTDEITQGAGNEYEAMCMLETWLAQNCTYNEAPGIPPEDADFVAHFLETREGYCTYYASAMAVMARTYGLPSRYVTGYGLVREGSSARIYVARELTAHAWAEVYFHGIGWVAFDPLNWDADALADVEFEVTGGAVAGPATPEPTPTPMSTPPPATDAPTAPVNPLYGYAWILHLALWILGAALAVLLLHIAAKLLKTRKDRQYALERLLRRMGRREAGLAYFTDLEKQLHLYNLDRDNGETLHTWAERVDRSLMLENASLLSVMPVFERMLYGGSAPFDEELRMLNAYHIAVEAALRAALGRSYLLRRAVR